MTSRISIFTNSLEKIGEFEAPTTPRSWVLNGYGKSNISVSTFNRKCSLKYLQYGHIVHIEHIPSEDEIGNIGGTLPSWTGILLPLRNWDLGILHFEAYTMEAILKLRAMPYLSVKLSPAEVFTKIFDMVNESAKNIIFHLGTVDNIDATYPDDLRTNAYDHIQKMIRDTGMEWSVDGVLNSQGNLDLYANLFIQKGVNTPLVLNNLNSELKSPLLTEQGTPSNQVFGYSQAYTNNTRYMQEAINWNSYNKFGPLQLNQIYMGKHDKLSTEMSSRARAEDRGFPSLLFSRTLLDVGNSFSYVNTGNIVELKETNAGFHPNGGLGLSSFVRVNTFEYNDLVNKVPMTIEVLYAS